MGFISVSEITNEDWRGPFQGFVQAFEGISATLGSFYFGVLTKDWSYIPYYSFALALIALAIVYWSVENPIFYQSRGETAKAEASLQRILEVNKSHSSDYEIEHVKLSPELQ